MIDNKPFKNVIAVTKREVSYRCPCCKFKTLHGRAQDEICPVCFWEDDGQDEHDADIVRGGPNGALSLREARQNYLQYRACDRKLVAEVRDPLPEER